MAGGLRLGVLAAYIPYPKSGTWGTQFFREGQTWTTCRIERYNSDMRAMTPELLAKLRARQRLDVDPPHLAPFGAVVRTTEGHLSELVGWLAPNPDEDSPIAGEHVALLSVVDGPLISLAQEFAFAPESEVILVRVQSEPRFARRE